MGRFMVLNIKYICILLLTFFILGCSSKESKKMIDLRDCKVMFPYGYKIDKSLDSLISIYPTNAQNGIYKIHFEDNINDKNGKFRDFLNSYSNQIITKQGHLELVEGVDTNMGFKVYLLIGTHFYITFVKDVADINNTIEECNKSWI